jgi:hypothetical protein
MSDTDALVAATLAKTLDRLAEVGIDAAQVAAEACRQVWELDAALSGESPRAARWLLLAAVRRYRQTIEGHLANGPVSLEEAREASQSCTVEHIVGRGY